MGKLQREEVSVATASCQKPWPILSPWGCGSCRLWCSRSWDADRFQELILPKITIQKNPTIVGFFDFLGFGLFFSLLDQLPRVAQSRHRLGICCRRALL